MVRWNGFGSQTLSSHTSLSASGYARDAAPAEDMTVCKYRRGDDETGELSTRTSLAEGVAGGSSTGCSKSR